MIGNKIIALGLFFVSLTVLAVGGLGALFSVFAVPSVLGLTGLFLGLVFIIIGIVGVGVAVGLWHEKVWALWLTMAYIVIEALITLATFSGLFNLVELVVDLILAVYLLSILEEFD